MSIMKNSILIAMLWSGLTSCFNEYLDKKPDQKLVVPASLTDFQALLDNVNSSEMNADPALGFIAADDFYITDAGFSSLIDIEKNAYIWADEVYGANGYVDDWIRPYRQIFCTNVVLEGVEKIKPEESEAEMRNAVKGSALFFRATAYYNLAQLFRPAYSVENAAETPGLPLKLESNVNLAPVISELQMTYNQILKDLTEAAGILPESSHIKSRPDRKAANAMLARVYLTMGMYELAEQYADKVLQQYRVLIDYNTLQTSSTRPFPPSLPGGNPEVLFHSVIVGGYPYLRSTLVSVDPSLYNAYADNDLRKLLFFRSRANGIYTFKGSYGPALPGNTTSLFSGLSTDEVFLIRAECRARRGDVPAALEDLNTLLVTRWVTGTYSPYEAGTAKEALDIILLERRKQLVGRGLRWTDLRRLNQSEEYAKEISRTVNGQKIILAPGDKKYTFPVPVSELTNGVEQNPR